MERWQSAHEHYVGANLSESGVEPISLGELLDEREVRDLLRYPLGYAETRGSQGLREAIASLYPECGPENILVTTGTSEANLLVTLGTLERNAQAVTVLPNYLQVWGLAKSLGCSVHVLPLRDRSGWQPDLEEAKEVITPGTQAISVCNPNNPTGVRLSSQSTQTILDLASDADAWILSDEVYRGAEREGDLTPSFWGRHEKVLVTSGLSKAFGLAGLRLGWICGPQDMIEQLWSIHDYTTIAVTKVTEVLGTLAVAEWREGLWSRARKTLRHNFPVLKDFVARNELRWVPPEAGAIAFLRYPWKLPSTKVAAAALQRDVLVVPGSYFRQDGYLRVGYGMSMETLEEGLGRLEATFRELRGA